MKKELRFFERLTDGMDLAGEPVPGCPLVEISGERQVLIENHLGISRYSMDEICVKVKYGCVSICGNCLELVCMSEERLIISGKIDLVKLVRGVL